MGMRGKEKQRQEGEGGRERGREKEILRWVRLYIHALPTLIYLFCKHFLSHIHVCVCQTLNFCSVYGR